MFVERAGLISSPPRFRYCSDCSSRRRSPSWQEDNARHGAENHQTAGTCVSNGKTRFKVPSGGFSRCDKEEMKSRGGWYRPTEGASERWKRFLPWWNWQLPSAMVPGDDELQGTWRVFKFQKCSHSVSRFRGSCGPGSESTQPILTAGSRCYRPCPDCRQRRVRY
jgi:hypothetical protein